ncbi:MAG: hypothetical protein NTX03_05065 [Bacteroidetes bacterium]|nr:hypothetical protein [Bacteroidota bacterium]
MELIGLEDLAFLEEETAAIGERSALSFTRAGVLIEDEFALTRALDKVYIEGENLFVRTRTGGLRGVGRVTGRSTVNIEHFGNTRLPGEIYRVSRNGVRVRSGPFTPLYQVWV